MRSQDKHQDGGVARWESLLDMPEALSFTLALLKVKRGWRGDLVKDTLCASLAA